METCDVFRLEDEHGVGCYRFKYTHEWQDEIEIVTGVSLQKGSRHPAPIEDKLLVDNTPEDYWRFGTLVASSFYFGFSSPQQVASWFNKIEMYLLCEEYDLRFSVYSAKAFHGEAQCIFEKRNAFLKESFTPTEFFDKFVSPLLVS